MQTPAGTSDNNPVPAILPVREIHTKIPLEGEPPNAILSLSDDLLCYLIAAIRNIPRTPPDLSIRDWQAFLTLLQSHGITPIITYHVRTWPEECRPPHEIMERLHRIFLFAAANTLRAGRQIQEITNAMEDAGIPVILMKGHALARTVYPDPALRQSSDIDLLVQPHNIPSAEEVLEKLGYACTAKTFYIAQYDHHEVFCHPDKGLPVELHWIADNAFNLFPEGWLDGAFSRRIPIRTTDLSCDTFSHTDHLLFLVFHNIFQHWSIRLDRVYDISRMMKDYDTPAEWKRLGQLSVEHNIRVPMELAFTISSLWSGSQSSSDPVGNYSVWPKPGDRELHLLKYAAKRRSHLFSNVFLIIQGQPGLLKKLRYIGRFIFPPVPLLAGFRKSVSSSDIPLAYLRRWFSVIKDW